MILRMKYQKTREGRYLSHLDLLRTLERSFRRAGLPLAFSEGFNPHPKISYASALAVGVTSEGEYLDVELKKEVSVASVKAALEKALPPGLNILEIEILDQKRADSLTSIINMARYRVETALTSSGISRQDLEKMFDCLLSQAELPVTRQGKKGPRQVNIREGIYRLKEVGLKEDRVVLEMDLQTGSQGNVRPEEVVAALREFCSAPLAESLLIQRMGLFIQKDDSIKTPLDI